MAKENEKSNVLKIILILLIVILVPIIIFSVIYFNNIEVKNTTNEVLKEFPGIIGEHFSKYPTKDESEDKKIYLAKYYISLDEKIAADKMYIIKKDDEILFNDIVKYMNEISPPKTENIIKLVRNIELRKDLLFSIYDEIENGKEESFRDEIKRIEDMDNYLATKKIEDEIINDNEESEKYAEILSFIDDEKVVELFYHMNIEIKNKIINKIPLEKRKTIELIIEEKQLKENELINMARSYENKDSLKLFDEIGNDNLYSMDKLSIIYDNLSVKKAAEILFYSKDEQFVEQLFGEIRKIERYDEKDGQSKTINIRRYINFLNQYERGIDELVKVYEKMDAKDVANIVSKMMINDKGISLFQIDENYQHEISDATIILDIIKKMKKSTTSSILDNLDSRKAAEISRRLAIP